ncbi:hypothetical protein AURDEDRAFT_115192 [Auricularia subglabra TFB-10046 SS5]|nr:hypothetical protein AURDEDRAFT_115192 [Auricularia subglabra TFB-10046 SS5]
MRFQLAAAAAGVLALLPAAFASPLDKRRTCTVNPLRVTNFRTVDNGAGLHTVSFDFSFGTAEWSSTLEGSCTLEGSNLPDATGACTPPGAASFQYDGQGGLSVGVDFLCSPDSGIPQVVVFKGAVPLECAAAPGARACQQNSDFELPLVSQ